MQMGFAAPGSLSRTACGDVRHSPPYILHGWGEKSIPSMKGGEVKP